MWINRAYKVELDPNNVQRTTLLKHAGVARFTYNWGLIQHKEAYEQTGTSPNNAALHKQLVSLKKTDFPWMYEVSKCAPQGALFDLDDAFKNFFRGNAKYPKFKSRKNGIGSFQLFGHIKVFHNAIQLPRNGRIRLKEKGYIPLKPAYIYRAIISERMGRWFVSLHVKEEISDPINTGPVVGIDMGISTLATVSDGTVIENPRALNRFERKKKRLQRSLSRKKKDSKNRADAKMRLAKCHFRIANTRRDAQHKATTMLTKTNSVIGVESLNLNGLIMNRSIAGQLKDASIGEFLRQIQYKAKWYGATVVKAEPFYPSTKKCSACGQMKVEVPLSERIYTCDNCGFKADRDINAALNLASVAASWADTQNACKRGEVHANMQVLLHEAGTEHCLGGS